MSYVSNVDYPQDRWDLARALMRCAARLMYFRSTEYKTYVGNLEILLTDRWLFVGTTPGISVSAQFEEAGSILSVYINDAITERELITWRELLERELLLDELAHA